MVASVPSVKHLRFNMAPYASVEDERVLPQKAAFDLVTEQLESISYSSAPFHPTVLLELIERVLASEELRLLEVDGRVVPAWLESVNDMRSSVGDSVDSSGDHQSVLLQNEAFLNKKTQVSPDGAMQGDYDTLDVVGLFCSQLKAWIVGKEQDPSCDVRFEWKYSSARERSISSITGYSFCYKKNW